MRSTPDQGDCSKEENNMAGNTGKRQASDNLRRMTALSFLSALIAVLSIVGNYLKIPIGPLTVPITLTLCPIIIGGAL